MKHGKQFKSEIRHAVKEQIDADECAGAPLCPRSRVPADRAR